jgi:leucyl-tRNA synthetase
MRSEFLYFYPLDSRHSGRDLVPNHLTFFIFNHVAIFSPSLWPRQIVVNGSVLMEGKKMSKSLGNIIPLRKAIRMYGADTLRVSILSASELLQDADFSDSLARTTKVKLQEFYKFSLKYCDAPAASRRRIRPTGHVAPEQSSARYRADNVLHGKPTGQGGDTLLVLHSSAGHNVVSQEKGIAS